jgi:limonene-1,2-epoxide hydrolase
VNDEAVGELAHMPECGRSTPKTPAPTPQADRADFGAGLGGIESELVQMTVSSGRSIYGSLVRRPGISQRIGVTGPPRMIARSTFGTQRSPVQIGPLDQMRRPVGRQPSPRQQVPRPPAPAVRRPIPTRGPLARKSVGSRNGTRSSGFANLRVPPSGRYTVGTAEDAERVVRDFCAAFDGTNAEALRPYFTEDIVYHNIPLDPAIGIDATIAFIEAFFGMCQSMTIETVHLAVRDNVVLTERIDTFHVGEVVAPLLVMGTFEVRDGKISAWRDYFDLGQITEMLSGAV